MAKRGGFPGGMGMPGNMNMNNLTLHLLCLLHQIVHVAGHCATRKASSFCHNGLLYSLNFLGDCRTILYSMIACMSK